MVLCVVAATIVRGRTGASGDTGPTGSTGNTGPMGATGKWIGPKVRSNIKTPSSTDLVYRETCPLISKYVIMCK